MLNMINFSLKGCCYISSKKHKERLVVVEAAVGTLGTQSSILKLQTYEKNISA